MNRSPFPYQAETMIYDFTLQDQTLLFIWITDFGYLNRTFKQPSSWFTAPRQRSLLEKFLATGAATGNRTRVSRLHVQRADHYTMAAE